MPADDDEQTRAALLGAEEAFARQVDEHGLPERAIPPIELLRPPDQRPGEYVRKIGPIEPGTLIVLALSEDQTDYQEPGKDPVPFLYALAQQLAKHVGHEQFTVLDVGSESEPRIRDYGPGDLEQLLRPVVEKLVAETGQPPAGRPKRSLLSRLVRRSEARR